MAKDTVEIPVPVLSSIETLDELQDWLTAQNLQVVAELREARRQDLAGECKAWERRHVPWPTESK
jgi:predicted aldo/keto reductase-like oxidoreductase